MVQFSASKPVKITAVGILTVGALFAAPAAFAADSFVAQSVTGGNRTATATGPALAAVTTSHTAATSTAGATLAVDDLTGTGAGWRVTQSISAFVYSGANGGTNIEATAFSITPGTATSTNSAPMTGVAVGLGGTLEVEKTVLNATAGNGVGAYSLANDGTLTIPADARAGTYTGTLTTTIIAGP